MISTWQARLSDRYPRYRPEPAHPGQLIAGRCVKDRVYASARRARSTNNPAAAGMRLPSRPISYEPHALRQVAGESIRREALDIPAFLQAHPVRILDVHPEPAEAIAPRVPRANDRCPPPNSKRGCTRLDSPTLLHAALGLKSTWALKRA
jgi:hypothetical protein